jgi:hypothetical protein
MGITLISELVGQVYFFFFSSFSFFGGRTIQSINSKKIKISACYQIPCQTSTSNYQLT